MHKPEQVNQIVHKMENAVYFGFNLRCALLEEDEEILGKLVEVLDRVESKRPGKEKNPPIYLRD